jgi:hypothetical protein
MARKNIFLNNYILIQSIFILVSIVVFLYLRKQLIILENNPKVIAAAHRQMILSEDITETCLLIDKEVDPQIKAGHVTELISLLKEYPLSKKVMFDHLHESKLKKEEKKNVSDLFDKANNYFNKVCVSSTILSQKYTNEEKVKQMNELIIKNKTRYVISMTKILGVFDQQTNAEIQSVRSKEHFLFLCSIIMAIFNLILVITPMKHKLVV